MTALLPTLLEEFQEKISTFNNRVIREIKLSNVLEKIVVAIGMRRTGKTYFMLQIIINLVKNKKIPLSRILYINFEDDRLYPLTQKKLSNLLDEFYTIYPDNHNQICYLFLDEIQNIPNWYTVIRRYFDSKRVKIYLTGSSAKLLSKEIHTSLRGRSITKEIWPFSFAEFLKAKQIAMPKSFGKITLDKITYWLKIYIKQGGFPETIIFNKPEKSNVGFGHLHENFGNGNFEQSGIIDEERRKILQDYVAVVIFRDIVERYKITNISLIRYLIKFLIKNVGCLFSVNKLYNDLKTQGFSLSKTTIHDYLHYIEDAYLAFRVPLYSESLRKTQSNPQKIYVIDTGLANANNFSFSENIGHYFENLIYLDLRRAQHNIYYYLTKTRKEIDFLTQDLKGKWHLFQVCWDMADDETLEREVSALREAEQELKIKGICITPHSYFTLFLPVIYHS